MDRIAMLNGLSGKDFSALGTILATAATGAAVHGLMYPMTEVAYGLSDNFIKNVTPESWRKPLPQGYKPQTVKMDKPNFQDKDKDWDKHRKIMDQLDGDQLRGYTMTLDPKFSNDAYSYLVGRGINPSDNDSYLPGLRNTKLNFSEGDEKKEVEAPSEDTPKNTPNDSNVPKYDPQTIKDAKRFGLGAGAYLLFHKNRPTDRPIKNLLKATALGVGTAAVLNALDKNGSESGDKSEEPMYKSPHEDYESFTISKGPRRGWQIYDEEDFRPSRSQSEREYQEWCKNNLYTDDYISRDQGSYRPKHTDRRDMSMLDGLFGTPEDFGIKKNLAGIGLAASMFASLYGGAHGLSASNIQRENLNHYTSISRTQESKAKEDHDKANEYALAYMTGGHPFDKMMMDDYRKSQEDRENYLKDVNSKIKEIKEETPSKIASETAKGAAKGAGVGAGAGSLLVAAGSVAKALNNKKEKDDPQDN